MRGDDEAAGDQAFAYANLRRNFVAHFIHGMLGMTGMRLVHAPTFLPAYLHAVSGSAATVGLGLALLQGGAALSPLMGAAHLEGRPRLMPAAMWMGGLARLTVLGMAVAAWTLSDQALVVALLAMMFLFGLFMGAQRVVFSLLLAKVIPLRVRGRLQAWRNATGGLIAAILAWAAGVYLVEPQALGNGYAATFLLAFILTWMGLLALQRLMREPPLAVTPPAARFRDRLRSMPRALAEDRVFAAFMLVLVLSGLARMATPFFVIHSGRRLALDGELLGLLSFAFLGAETVTNLVWGYLGDRVGFKSVLLGSLVLWMASIAMVLQADSLWSAVAAFFALGGALSGQLMASQTLILELGSRDQLPMRVGLSATVEGAAATVGPLVGGAMAAVLGLPPVFVLAAILLGASALLLLVAVPEPRRGGSSGSGQVEPSPDG